MRRNPACTNHPHLVFRVPSV